MSSYNTQFRYLLILNLGLASVFFACQKAPDNANKLLKNILNNPDGRIQGTCIIKLIELGETALPALQKACQNQNVRGLVINLMHNFIRDKIATDKLSQKANKMKIFVPLLLDGTNESAQDIWIPATRAISYIDTPALPEIMQRLKDNKLKALRCYFIFHMDLASRLEAVPMLLALLPNPNAEVRVKVIYSLKGTYFDADYGTPYPRDPTEEKELSLNLVPYQRPPTSALFPYFTDPSPEVHRQAIITAIDFSTISRDEVNPKEIVPLLLEILKVPDKRVGTRALSILEKIGVEAKEAVPVLQQILSNTPPTDEWFHAVQTTQKAIETSKSAVTKEGLFYLMENFSYYYKSLKK